MEEALETLSVPAEPEDDGVVTSGRLEVSAPLLDDCEEYKGA